MPQSSSSWSGQGLSPARSELPGQGLAQVLEGLHLRHVDVLVGVGAVDVQLPGVHLTPVGLEGGVVVGDPLRVAVLVRAHRVAHDADVVQHGVDAGVPGDDGGPGVLAENGGLPRQSSSRLPRDVTVPWLHRQVPDEGHEAGPLRAEGHAERVVGTGRGHVQAGQLWNGGVEVHRLHQGVGGQVPAVALWLLGSEFQAFVQRVVEGEHFSLGGPFGRDTGDVDHHGDPRGDVEVGVFAPLAVFA